MNTTPTPAGQAVEAAEREKFEIFVRSLPYFPTSFSGWEFQRSKGVPDMYENNRLDDMWKGWKAGRAELAALQPVQAEPCQNPNMPPYACENRHQCWEPCGELGHSAEHVRVGRRTPAPVPASPVVGVEVTDAEVDEAIRQMNDPFGPSRQDMRRVLEMFAASRVPVASPAEPVAYRYKDSRGHWRYVGHPFTPGWDMPASLKHEPLYATPPVGAGGSVGAIPFVGFVARHADRSKTDTTTSVAVDASREQIQDHLAVADSRRVQASNSRVYTDAQLAAGVEALGICRGMGIPLSDETVAGVVYDYMTAAGPKRPLTIYMDEDPIDVEQFYRAKGFEKLPATPTMTGQEIRDCGWKKQHEYQMFIYHGNTGVPFEPIGTTQAIVLVDGMRFISIPPATW